MSSLEPEVFLFGKDLDLNFKKRFFHHWHEGKHLLHENAILVFHWEDLLGSKRQISEDLKAAQHSVIHFIPQKIEDGFFQDLNGMKFTARLSEWSVKKIESLCSLVIQDFRQKSQEDDLILLLESQLAEVQNQVEDFEKELGKKNESIEKEEQKYKRQKDRKEATERILLATLQSESLEDLEVKILKSLAPIYQIEKVQIKIGGESAIHIEDYDVHTLEIPLLVDSSTTASIYFVRQDDFKKYEENYLKEISEVIAIAVDRWLFSKNLQAWQASWTNTFKAIDCDIAIIDQDYNLINSNHFDKRGKCYNVLFGKDRVCDGCNLGKDFQIHAFNQEKDQMDYFDVSGQSLLNELNQTMYVHFYYPATEKVMLERAKLESAKFVELGVVGSSIAHELNNPLSGILSYIQILLSEVEPDTETYESLLDMQEAAKKCEAIIQNLLNFTRKGQSAKGDSVSLKAGVDTAIQLVEPDLNKVGIEIKKKNLIEDEVEISENLFVQILVEVIKNAIEEFQDMGQKSNANQIEFQCRKDDETIGLEIIDNGRGISEYQIKKVFSPMFTTKNPSFHRGLGLTTAYHILQQSGGSIEILPNRDHGTRVKITFSRKKRTP